MLGIPQQSGKKFNAVSLWEINNVEIFLLILTLTSFLYASVGHGGASGYLALMALFSFSPLMIRPTALLLNLFVSGVAFYHFYRVATLKEMFFCFSHLPLSPWLISEGQSRSIRLFTSRFWPYSYYLQYSK